LLTAGQERLTAAQVRDLLGIVEAETVDAFVTALVRGDALAGMGILQDLEDRGRDLRAFLNQVVEALRDALVARLTDRARSRPPAAIPPPAAAAAPPDEALDQLYRVWPDIVAWISKSPPAKPLISVCRPIAIDGNVVTLGFPESQAFLKDVAERRRAILEEGVG